MKISPLFVIREIADDSFVIPLGEKADQIKGILALNKEGAFLWKLLETDQTEESLIHALTENFSVDENTARKDVANFLQDLRNIDCLM